MLDLWRWVPSIPTVNLAQQGFIMKQWKSLPYLQRSSMELWWNHGFEPRIPWAVFVLICCWKEFPMSAVNNRFELRCQWEQLLLLYYKVCRCFSRCYYISLTVEETGSLCYYFFSLCLLQIDDSNNVGNVLQTICERLGMHCPRFFDGV